MSTELVGNCPRCGADKITFSLTQENVIKDVYGWQYWYETFCICRNCNRSSIFVLSMKDPSTYVRKNGLLNTIGTVNNFMNIEGIVSLKDRISTEPPEHLPTDISAVFQEGCTCLSVNCFNAAGTMFRLAIDMATNGLLPKEDIPGLSTKIRRDLGLRLPWLFDNGKLPSGLKDLSTCIKDDGNDGAHRGSLQKEDAEDLLDFTFELLERLFTEPERLKIASDRREARRKT